MASETPTFLLSIISASFTTTITTTHILACTFILSLTPLSIWLPF